MITPVRRMLLLGALCAAALTARAQVIELRATINAAQENPATTSPATGTAIMLYDIGTNTFDLMVSITGMANTATASHIHEAVAGANGPVVTGLGAEAVYTRTGNTLTATFRNVTHLGDKLKLINGSSYYNIHSAQFPGGEVRGQLIPRPVRLVANMTVAQEAAVFPALNFSALNDFGAAVMFYDPMANTISLRSSIYNFNNTFSNSHFHEGAPGIGGPVVHNLGNNANAGGYNNTSGAIQGSFDAPFLGNPLSLLAGNLYLNYHSSGTFSNGELRGQVRVSNELATTRFANLSVRGFVGTGEQVLIQGITVNGPDPIRAVITAKGPSLTAFGITGALANPRLALHDSAGRQIAVNDDVGTVAAGSELASIPGVPRNTLESALVVVLPPGNYTAIVSAASGTGVALLEVTDLRNFTGVVTAASADASLVLLRDRAASPKAGSMAAAAARAALELCSGVPLTVAVAQR
ncbi:MAG TPA: CHRD domain-containing protein [Opitutaceae bacterium]|nr:CHRD domain-containing protein [Opitutaceae bacterium]